MAELVYVMCAVTSALCAACLFRGWLESRARLLLWSALCFTGLAVNNALLFLDLVALPDVDLSVARSLVALASMLVLLVGLVWESK
jgi:hydrogenase/urease accessory protein HupE